MDLTLEDFEAAAIEVVEVTILGKTGYLREMMLEDQIELGEVGGEMSNTDQMRCMVAASLCSKDGTTRLFADLADGVDKLRKVNGEELMTAHGKVMELNGLNVEATKENS